MAEVLGVTMNSQMRREIADLRSITSSSEYSGSTPILRFRTALPGVRREFAASAASSPKRKHAAAAAWAILILAIVVSGTFWATNQLCGLMAQRVPQMQRQRYRPQMEYSDLWNKGRH